MLDMNFVPDDYIKNSESHRTNLFYLILLAIVMAGIGASFMTVKVRQQSLDAREKVIDAEMARKKEDIRQAQELQQKSTVIWKTALTTTDLLEPVPRSVLLASLTNNLPAGVSLLSLNLIQKKSKEKSKAAASTKYGAKKIKKAAANKPQISPEKLLETHIDITGIAANDVQVAAYIEKLGNSSLFDYVALVESKEKSIDDVDYRQFKLKTLLKKDVHLTSLVFENL